MCLMGLSAIAWWYQSCKSMNFSRRKLWATHIFNLEMMEIALRSQQLHYSAYLADGDVDLTYMIHRLKPAYVRMYKFM